MLDAFIIEEIRRRDREREKDDRPVVELPLPSEPPPRRPDDGSPTSHDHDDDDKPGKPPPDHGVVIIEFA